MTLNRVVDLVGQNINGIKADMRSRNADGSLKYDGQDKPRIVTMKTVEYHKAKGETWLRWTWEKDNAVIPWDCGFSGICVAGGRYGGDPERAAQYYILMEDAHV